MRFPVLSVKERKRRRKNNRERGREKETAAKASGYWFVVMQSQSEARGGRRSGRGASTFLPTAYQIHTATAKGETPKAGPI